MHTSISENTHGAGTRHLLQIWVSVYVYSVILYMCVHTCALSFTCFDDFRKARGTGFNPLNEIDNLPWVCCCWRVVLAVLHTAFGKKKVLGYLQDVRKQNRHKETLSGKSAGSSPYLMAKKNGSSPWFPVHLPFIRTCAWNQSTAKLWQGTKYGLCRRGQWPLPALPIKLLWWEL